MFVGHGILCETSLYSTCIYGDCFVYFNTACQPVVAVVVVVLVVGVVISGSGSPSSSSWCILAWCVCVAVFLLFKL